MSYSKIQRHDFFFQFTKAIGERLQKSIAIQMQLAKKENKRLLLLVGEDHTHIGHTFVEYLIVKAAQRAGIKTVYFESTPKQVKALEQDDR